MSPPRSLRRGEFIRPPSSARPVAGGAPTSRVTHWPVAFRRSGGGRRVLARDQALEAQPDLADKALKVALTSGFALLGESLLAIAPKGTKRSCPCIRVSLRSTSLIPSLLRGSPRKGHPWPFTAFAASMPLTPLRSDSIRPPERGVRSRLLVWSSTNNQSEALLHCSGIDQATRAKSPFRRPSVGAAQGDARHGCRARSDGPGMALRDAPRSSAGARGVLRSKTRMQGWPSFWLLFLGHSRKSDSPSRAKPMPRRPAPMGYTPDIQSFVGWKTAKHFPPRSMQGRDLLVPFGATAKRDSPSRAKSMPWPTSAIGPKPQAKKSPRASSLVQNPAASPASGCLDPVATHRDLNEKSPLLCA